MHGLHCLPPQPTTPCNSSRALCVRRCASLCVLRVLTTPKTACAPTLIGPELLVPVMLYHHHHFQDVFL